MNWGVGLGWGVKVQGCEELSLTCLEGGVRRKSCQLLKVCSRVIEIRGGCSLRRECRLVWVWCGQGRDDRGGLGDLGDLAARNGACGSLHVVWSGALCNTQEPQVCSGTSGVLRNLRFAQEHSGVLRNTQESSVLRPLLRPPPHQTLTHSQDPPSVLLPGAEQGT